MENQMSFDEFIQTLADEKDEMLAHIYMPDIYLDNYEAALKNFDAVDNVIDAIDVFECESYNRDILTDEQKRRLYTNSALAPVRVQADNALAR